MSADSVAVLKSRLVSRYADLFRRLTRRLGSTERAADAMQETWLKLEGLGQVGVVGNPDAYLLRMASNIATDQFRRHGPLLNASELDDIMGLIDESDDPQRIASAQSDVEALQAALGRMPARRRAIMIAARLGGLSNQELSVHFGLSVSSVEKELRHAMRFCKQCLPELGSSKRGSMMGPRKF